MAGRRLPAFCRGSRATATVMRRRVQRVVAHGGYHSPASKLLLPAAAASFADKQQEQQPGARWWHAGGEDMVAGGGGGGRRVMVVADGRAEAGGALQWALSQAVRCNDAVLLLAVVKPPPPAAFDGGDGEHSSCVSMSRTRCYQQLEAMRGMCESARPEVKVEVCVVEAAGGRERAPAVVEAARRHGASLLVLGQRRRRRARAVVARWLLALWRRRGTWTTTVEYCIEHAPCVALGVRRRSSGGYLVSSKRQKDFWLLA
uniref:UspA domain-containing protein n=1 Tax=Leersia perrieri TaxID=77586 RepID=A0A0D9VW29_9ORYZ